MILWLISYTVILVKFGSGEEKNIPLCNLNNSAIFNTTLWPWMTLRTSHKFILIMHHCPMNNVFFIQWLFFFHCKHPPLLFDLNPSSQLYVWIFCITNLYIYLWYCYHVFLLSVLYISVFLDFVIGMWYICIYIYTSHVLYFWNILEGSSMDNYASFWFFFMTIYGMYLSSLLGLCWCSIN